MAEALKRCELERVGFRYLLTYGYNLELYACGSLRIIVDKSTSKVVQKYIVRREVCPV